MRRRESLNVWPAIADLMTILAVPSLFVSVGLYFYSTLAGFHPVPGADGGRHEIPKNERMFQAIQRAEDFVKEVRRASGLALDLDQTLRFGDDLVGFPLNGFEPVWRADGRARLRRYCDSIAATLRRRPGMRDRFVIYVEGHTDVSACPGQPGCNWWISANRAAGFVVIMRQPEICPEGARWKLLPTALADAQAVFQGPADRRIALRLAPDYKRIIDDVLGEAAGLRPAGG